MEGESTPLEEALLLGFILLVSMSPVLGAIAFGRGSPVEAGLGGAVSFGAIVALFRLARPQPNLVDRDDDDAPQE